jgi:hypothetical protein
MAMATACRCGQRELATLVLGPVVLVTKRSVAKQGAHSTHQGLTPAKFGGLSPFPDPTGLAITSFARRRAVGNSPAEPLSLDAYE